MTNKDLFIRNLLLVSVLILLLLPSFAFAVEWWPIVPCGVGDGPECTRCDIFKLVKNIIDFIIQGLMPPLAVLLFVWAGLLILLGGANVNLVAQGKTIFKNTFFGLLILLSAWMITNTIIKSVGGNFDKADAWWKFTCTEPVQATPPPVVIETPGPGPTKTPEPGELSEEEARSLLASAGITVNADSPQTKLEGMRRETINEIIRIKQACGCTVVVTGGTESGHAEGQYSHANGYKIDLRSQGGDDQLTRYIQNNYQLIGTRSGDPVYRAPNGTEYVLEDNHWDVCVGCL